MPAYSFPSLSFSSENQGVYGGGDATSFADEFAPTQPWDSGFDIDIGAGSVEITPSFRVWTPWGYKRVGAVTLDLNTGIEIDFETSGEFGIAAGYVLDGGSIDTQLVYDASATLIDALRAPVGTAAQFVAGAADVISGAFQTSPADAAAYLDVVYEFLLDLDVDLKVLGDETNLIDFTFDLPGPLDRTDDQGRGRFGVADLTALPTPTLKLIENIFIDGAVVDDDGIGIDDDDWFINVSPISDALTFEINPYLKEVQVKWGDIAIREFTPLAANGVVFDLAQVKVSFPQVAPEARRLTSSGTLEGEDKAAFLTSTLDLDGAVNTALVAYSGAFIPNDTKYKFGGLELKTTVLDVDAGPQLRLMQEFEVEPDVLYASVTFTDLDGTPVAVDLGDGAAPASTWQGAWADFPAIAIDDAVIATPSFSTGATLNNATSIEIGAILTAAFLGASYKLEYKGATVFNGDIGPLLELTLTEDAVEDALGVDDLTIPIFDLPVDLSGFEGSDGEAFIQGTPIVLDVEGTDDPGRSGVHDGINDNAPVGVSDALSAVEDDRVVFAALDLLGNDYDLDAYDTLSVTAVGAPSAGGAARLRADGSVVFDPSGDFEALAEGETATTEIVYMVSDAVGRTGTATATITVAGANDAPEAKNDVYQARTATFGDFVGIEGELWGSVLANDADPDAGDAPSLEGDGFARTITTALGAEVDLFLGSGNFEYDPSNIQGQLAGLGNGDALIDSFDYTVVDGSGASDTATVTFIILGEVPEGEEPVREVRIASGDLTLEEGETGEVIVYSTAPIEPGSEGGVTVGFSTDDGTIAVDPAAREFDATNPNLDPTISAETPAIVEVTPGDGDTPREATFAAEITESSLADPDLALGEVDTITITVAEAPAILASASEVAVTEGGAASSVGVRLSREPAGAVTVLVAASDPLVTLSAAALTFDASNWDVEQTITVAPPGEDTIDALRVLDLTLSIDQGATGDDFDGAGDVLVDVVVAPDNLAPTAVFDEATTDEDTAVEIDVLANDTDPDDDDLSVTGATVGTAALAANGTVAVDDDGTLTYTPDADFSGTDVITYTLDDGQDQATGSVVVTVNPVNDAPVAGGTIAVTAEETAVEVDLSDLVSDVDGDDLTYTVTNAVNGTVEDLGDGVFAFTPDVDFVNTTLALDDEGNVEADDEGNALYVMIDGAETAFFEYEVSDGTTTASGTALVMVTPVNDVPTAGADTAATDEDTAITIDPATLIANDADPEGGAVTFVDLVYGSATGFVWLDDESGLIEYDPNGQFEALAEGASATDTFSYVVEDELGAEGVGEVTVTITGVNDAPEAVADGFTVSLGASGAQDATSFGNLLDNDVDVDEGDALTASLGPNSADGLSNLRASVSVGSDGTFTYDVDGAFSAGEGEVGFDYFDYTVTDEAGATSEATVTVLVKGTNVGPGLALSRTDLTVEEPGTGDVFHVALTRAPTADVTVTITSSDETEAVPSVSRITFTPDDWDQPRFVDVAAVDDRIEDGDQSATITVAVSETTDADYAGLSETIAVTALDEGPSARIDVDVQSVTLTEGEAGADVAVTLGQAPTTDVVVTVDVGESGQVAASAATLTFTPANWDVAQTVTLSAVDDEEDDGPALEFVTLAVDEAASADEYADATPELVIAVALDDDEEDDAGGGDGDDGGDDNTAPTITGDAAPSVAENTAAVGTYALADAEGGTISVARLGEDADRFVFDATTGALTFVEAPDFEAPADADGDNVYEVTLEAADQAGATSSIDVAVTVTDVDETGGGGDATRLLINDVGYDVESAGGQDRGAGTVSADGTALTVEGNGWKIVRLDAEVTEDTVLAFTFEASEAAEIYGIGFDDDGTPSSDTTFQLAGSQGFGLDDYAYALGSGEVSYEIPVGAFFTGSFDRLVFAVDDDAGNGGSGTFSDIRVFEDTGTGGGDDTPFLINDEGFDVASFGASQDEGAATVSGDGTALTVEDNGWKVVLRDTVVTADTVLRFDFEATEAAEIYGIGFETDDRASAGTTFRLAGSQGWGIDDFATYAVGSGSASFEIPVGDYFTGAFDRLVFLADDDAGGGGSAAWSNVTLTEPDRANTAPTVAGAASVSVAENTAAVGTYAVADAEDDPVAVTLSGGDADRFVFDAATGALAFAEAPDFEAPADQGGDNVYDVTVEASDGVAVGVLDVAVTVTDEDEGAGPDQGRVVLTPDQPNTVFTIAAGDLVTVEGFDVDDGDEITWDSLIFAGDGSSAEDAAGFEALAGALATDGADRTRVEVDGDDLLIVTGTAEVLLTGVVGVSGLTEPGLLAAGAVGARAEPVLVPDQRQTVFEADGGDLFAVEGFDVDSGGEGSFDTLVLVDDGLSAATAAQFEAMAAALAADGVDRTRLEVRGDDLRVFGSGAEVLLADVVGGDGLTAQGLEDAGAILV